MSTPIFPEILGCPLLDSATYQPQDNIIRSPMGGPPKSRRRYTHAYEDVTLRIFCLNEAYLQILYDFYNITCSVVLPFEWVEWRDPSRGKAIYSFQDRPLFTPAGAGRWYADLKLELRTPFNGGFVLTNEIYVPLANENDEALTT